MDNNESRPLLSSGHPSHSISPFLPPFSSSLSHSLPVQSPSPSNTHAQLHVELYKNKKHQFYSSTSSTSSLPPPLSPLSMAVNPSRWLTKISPQRRLTPTRLLLVTILAILYLASVFGYIFALHSIPSKTLFFIIDRPLPILILLLVLIVYAERNHKTLMYTSFVFLGLILCFFANIIYAISKNEENVYAVSVSLVAKVSFTIAFTLGVGKGAPLRLLLCVPFYAFCGAVVALVYENININFILFIIDLFVTSTMGWRALALTSGFPGSDRAKLLLWLSVVGAALWMASDTLRIINSFYHPFSSTVFIAPLLYYLAQMANAFSVPRRLTRSDYWLDHFTFLIDQNDGQPNGNFKI